MNRSCAGRAFLVLLIVSAHAAYGQLQQQQQQQQQVRPRGSKGEGVPNFTVRAGYRVDLVSDNLGEVRFIEFGDKGIYVSCLCPQGVRTRLIECECDNPNAFLLHDSISAEDCAEAVVKSLEEEKFLILPHEEVADYIVKKAQDRDRWLDAIRKMRAAVLEERAKFRNGKN